MVSIKQKISMGLNLRQKSLNEISLEDIEFGRAEEESISREVVEMSSFGNLGNQTSERGVPQYFSVPCKIFWVEETRDLIVYVWNGIQSKTIIVPQDGWMVRNDVPIH